MSMMARARSGAVPIALFVTMASAYALVSSGFDVPEGLDDVKLARHMLTGDGLAFGANPGGTYAQGPDGRFYASHELGSVVMTLPAVTAVRAGAPVWGVTAIGSLLVSVCLSRGGVLVRAVRVSKQSESTHAPVG